MAEVLWLQEERCAETSLVGGKVAHLSRLASQHLVPPGFVVSIMEGDEALLPELERQIRMAYRSLAVQTRTEDVPVAVRSSAIDEDSPRASFAGQHDTYLNIRGEDAVLAAVAGCRRSALSHAAHEYRLQRGVPVQRPLIAVLVQILLHPSVSAVAFSANPITGAMDEVMINSSWGLGESIVGGAVTPDLFVLKRPALHLVTRQISSKEVMTVLSENGTSEIPVPSHLRECSSLGGSQLLEIGRLATRLEQVMGWPVDVECAVAYGELYLLQCRPITTLTR